MPRAYLPVRSTSPAWIGGSGRIGRRPPGELLERIERLLPVLSARQRREIDWILRTAD